MRKPRLSHTALDTADRCEYMYYLKYVKYIKPFVPLSYPLVTGVAFHSLMEHMYNAKDFSKEFLIRNWKKHFMFSVESVGNMFSNTEGYEEQLNYGYGMIHKFYDFAKRENYLREPLDVEWNFCIPVKNDQGKDFDIIGKVDLLIPLESNKLGVVDFKTSWKVPSQEDIDKNKQLTIYDWAVKHELKVSETVPIMFYSRKSEIRKTVRTVADHEAIIQDFKNLVKLREKGEYTYNLKSCGWCDFQKHCKYYKKSLDK